ncbi:MAG TPA: ABC transporter permease [Candidatus Nanoarchaeia archaeon]|nr:ABC transporter permease [Candidatus Nanoarchaeia archaeon]
MISNEIMRYSLENLKKRKTRSILTIFSILIGITTIFIFVSFGFGLYNYINSFVSDSSADKITIQPRGIGAPGLDDTFALTEDDLKAVEKTSGVYEASGLRFTVTEISQGSTKKYVFASGLDPKKELFTELSNVEIFKGRNLEKNERGKVILGHNYLVENKIFSKALDINDNIKIEGENLKIVGFYESLGNPQDDSSVYMTNTQFKEIYNDSRGYSMIIARVDTTNIPQVINNVEKELRSSRNLEEGKEDFFVASFEDLLETYTSALGFVIGFVILIALISVIVSAINTSNTMITSVLERTSEIGVLKSIGARNIEVFNLFLFESGVLGFISGILGVLGGFLFTEIARKILFNLGWSFLAPYYSVELFVGCVLFATITGAISGVVPAINASRVNPVEALRHE